jgi:serine/threonine-protein kinase
MQLYELPKDIKQLIDSSRIWKLLLENQWEFAGQILHKYPLTLLTVESSVLFILYGCWLAATENKEISEVHFSGVLDVAYPRTWNLLSHYINHKISDNGKWGAHAFMWEKRQLYRQLHLYYHCTGEMDKAKHFEELERHQYVTDDSGHR